MYGSLGEYTWLTVWIQVLQVNLNTVFTLCRDVGAHMLTRDGPHRGSIINVSV